MKSFARRFFLFVFLAAIAGLIVYGMWPAPVEADLAAVTRGTIRETVDQDGKTRIRERYVVAAPLAGRLQRIELDAGDRVEAGETLVAVIEPLAPELLDDRALEQAEANVRAAEARLARTTPLLDEARANLALAESELQRSLAARERNPQSITASEIDDLETLRRTRGALVRAAEQAQDVARFELEQAQAALQYVRLPEDNATSASGGEVSHERRAPYPEQPDERRNFVIRAPINGAVFRVLQESATVVTPGTELVEIGDPRDLEVEIDVLSRDAVKIRPGAAVQLEQWGGDKPLNGTVRVVEPSGFTKISTLGVEEQRVNVIVDLTDPPSQRAALGDGFRVEARIVIAEANDVLKAPTSALFRVGDDWAVFRLEEGFARQRIVQVGLQNGLEAEIVAGVSEGDVVITHPGDNVVDGVAVKPR
ncbi:MAG: efflux transporter periplasmic adaptor subunit [Planctomycetota bacterium]|nr:MAG: efflux transporter periplasmic adaptor subunit [Planctomycetota bacterium]